MRHLILLLAASFVLVVTAACNDSSGSGNGTGSDTSGDLNSGDGTTLTDTSADTSAVEVIDSTDDLTTADASADTSVDTSSFDVAQDLEETDTSTVAECQPRNPFVATGATTAWRHWDTEWIVTLQGDGNHRGQDVVVAAGQPQRLIGKFAYGLLDDDLEDEDVELFYQVDPPCGDWVSMGIHATTTDGQMGTVWGIADDGGRIFFELPAQHVRPVGRTPIRMLVQGDHSVAAFTLIVVEPGTQAVVCDIDGTLTTGDSELILDFAASIYNGSHVPEMYPGAPDVVWSWSDKGYLPIYVTGRPDMLRERSQQWLVDMGFPAGAVHLTDTNAQALPTSGGVATYKREFIQKVQTEAQATFYAAYGNATTDIEAYEGASIDKARTFIIGTNGGTSGTVAINSYPEHLPTAQAMPMATTPAPPEYGWW